MSRIPGMRFHLEPLEGLRSQLQEFKGFATIVPSLVESARQARWDEIGERPGDGEVVDDYESEAGPEEGYGWADFERTALSSALVLAWEVFREFLVGEFIARMNYWVQGTPEPIHLLRDEEERKLSRDFERLRKRYASMLGVPLTEKHMPRWDEVEDIRLFRHAIIHNQGFYTPEYVRRPKARPPTKNIFTDDVPPREQWVNQQLIPLDQGYVTAGLDLLLDTAVEVSQRLGS